MTKLLYAHDHKFYNNGEDFYSNGSFSTLVLNRYIEVFGQMKFISRQSKTINVSSNLTKSSHPNVEFIEISNLRSLTGLLNYSKVNSVIKKEVKNSDCVIARLPSTIGEIAVKHAKRNNIPYLIELVGCAWDANINHGKISGKIIAPFEYLINKKLIYNAPYVIYITKNFLQSRYPTKGRTAVCPNVNIENVDEIVLKNRICKIKTKDTNIKFGLIGSLDVNYKGHDTVIKALGAIKNEIPNFTIEFLGGGSPSRWSTLVQEHGLVDNIVYLGTVPNGKKVYEWIDQVDILLQPSYAEAQGRSIIEAMSRGCPVIASKVGGVIELLEDQWLIKPGNSFELSEKIKLMLSCNKYQLEQSKYNFYESEQYYRSAIENNRNRFLKLFKDQLK